MEASYDSVKAKMLAKIAKYKLTPYKVDSFNRKIKKERLKDWKSDYDNDPKEINEMVARWFMYMIAKDLFKGVEEIDFENESKKPEDYFQMRMYIGPFVIDTSPFIYVDNKHRVVLAKTEIEILDDNYDTIAKITP